MNSKGQSFDVMEMMVIVQWMAFQIEVEFIIIH